MTTYYVDPADGDDGNLGTSPGLGNAWATLPGTRNAGDTGYLNTNSISAGDIIEIKAGSAFTSANCGRVQITSTYYDNGTSGFPIVIKVSTTDGTGDVTFDFTGVTSPQYRGFIEIEREYITLQGNSTDGIVCSNGTNANGLGILIYGIVNSCDNPTLEYVTYTGHSFSNIGVGPCDGGTISNCHFDDGTWTGAQLGLASDYACTNFTITDSSANGNAPGYDTQDNNLPHGWHCIGAHSIDFVRCEGNGNGRDGFDIGIGTGTGLTSVATLTDCVSIGNGEDGIGCNNQAGTPANSVTVTAVNHIFYGNNDSGSKPYDGVTAYYYHCVFAFNARGLYAFTGDASLDTAVTARNCIFLDTGTVVDTYVTNGGLDVDLDYCLFKPNAADTETFYSHFGVGDYAFSVADPSDSWLTYGANNTKGIATVINFDATDNSVFANNDFHVSATTDAEDAGVYIAGAATDLDEEPRSDPPEIGLYEIVSGGGPTTYYINPDTTNTTKNGLSHATAFDDFPSITAGNSYYLYRGTTLRRTVTVNCNASNVTIGAYYLSGVTPVTDRNTSLPMPRIECYRESTDEGDWSLTEAGVWEMTISNVGPFLLGLGSLGNRYTSSWTEQRNYSGTGFGSSTFDPGAGGYGQWDSSGYILYIASDINPVLKWGTVYYGIIGWTLGVSLGTAITGSVVQDILFRYASYGARISAFNEDTITDCTVQYCESEHCFNGITTGPGYSSYLDNITVTNCSTYACGRTGIQLGSNTINNPSYCTRNQVFDTGGAQGIGGIYSVCTGTAGNEMYILDNRVDGMIVDTFWGESHSLYSDGPIAHPAAYNIWRRNRATNSPSSSGLHNNTGSAGIEFSGNIIDGVYEGYVDTASDDIALGGAEIYNNIFTNVTGGFRIFRNAGVTFSTVLRNNIFQGTGVAASVSTQADILGGTDEDYNYFDGFLGSNVNHTAGSNSVEDVDPELGSNYMPTVTSPVIGGGVTPISTDFYGRTFVTNDVGAVAPLAGDLHTVQFTGDIIFEDQTGAQFLNSTTLDTSTIKAITLLPASTIQYDVQWNSASPAYQNTVVFFYSGAGNYADTRWKPLASISEAVTNCITEPPPEPSFVSAFTTTGGALLWNNGLLSIERFGGVYRTALRLNSTRY